MNLATSVAKSSPPVGHMSVFPIRWSSVGKTNHIYLSIPVGLFIDQPHQLTRSAPDRAQIAAKLPPFLRVANARILRKVNFLQESKDIEDLNGIAQLIVVARGMVTVPDFLEPEGKGLVRFGHTRRDGGRNDFFYAAKIITAVGESRVDHVNVADVLQPNPERLDSHVWRKASSLAIPQPMGNRQFRPSIVPSWKTVYLCVPPIKVVICSMCDLATSVECVSVDRGYHVSPAMAQVVPGGKATEAASSIKMHTQVFMIFPFLFSPIKSHSAIFYTSS